MHLKSEEDQWQTKHAISSHIASARPQAKRRRLARSRQGKCSVYSMRHLAAPVKVARDPFISFIGYHVLELDRREQRFRLLHFTFTQITPNCQSLKGSLIRYFPTVR